MSVFPFLRLPPQDDIRRERLLLSVAAAFIFLNAITLSITRRQQLFGPELWAPLVWLGATAGASWLLQRRRPGHDHYLLPIFALLTGWGILLQSRLAPNFLWRQVIWVVLGTAVVTLITALPPNLRLLRRYRYTWLTLGLLLLAATLIFGVNPEGYVNAEYWLRLPIPFSSIFFQPSELLKLLLVIFLASYFDDRETWMTWEQPRGRLNQLVFIAPLLLMWGFCMIFLIWQEDLGAATLFFILFLGLIYLATGNGYYVGGGLGLLLLAGVIAYRAFPLIALRIDTWLHPWPEATDRAFQIVQSLYALGAGGLLGTGFNQGFPTYIPVVHSDFVFAAIGEEWGLMGTVSVVLAFALLAYRGMRLALLARRPFHRYLAAGITLLFSAQSFLIMAGVTKLLPLTGVTLPFVSYGGSSLLVSSVMIGLLLYLSTTQQNE